MTSNKPELAKPINGFHVVLQKVKTAVRDSWNPKTTDEID
jgi:hypothetical protein